MKLAIRHQTLYRYTEPVAYTIQQLRLTPRRDSHQHVLSWHVKSPGKCQPFVDAFGNPSHMLTITGRHAEVSIVAEGEVEIALRDRGRLPEPDVISPLVFTVSTPLTETTEAVAEFAARWLTGTVHSHALLALADAIRGAVAYQSGATGVASTATDALLLGQGVCQDHAHLFLACCRAHNIPARYVSGYIDPGNTGHAASHAWVDAWVEETDYSGWISIDVTHACFETDSYCRLAIGRDYESASPVRGVRRGGGAESLAVTVRVDSAAAVGGRTPTIAKTGPATTIVPTATTGPAATKDADASKTVRHR